MSCLYLHLISFNRISTIDNDIISTSSCSSLTLFSLIEKIQIFPAVPVFHLYSFSFNNFITRNVLNFMNNFSIAKIENLFLYFSVFFSLVETRNIKCIRCSHFMKIVRQVQTKKYCLILNITLVKVL